MSPPPVSFAVARFEWVAAAPGTVLLRVAGHWRTAGRARLSPPVLLVDDGHRSHRLAALPGPDEATPLAAADGPLWRAAFPAPAALLDRPRVAYALDAGPRGLVDLPCPAPWAARRDDAERRSAALGTPATRPGVAPSEVSSAASEAVRKLPDAGVPDLRAALAAERARREQAEQAAEHQSSVVQDLEERLAGERAARVELDARLADERLLRLRAEEAVEEAREDADADVSWYRGVAQAEVERLARCAADQRTSADRLDRAAAEVRGAGRRS